MSQMEKKKEVKNARIEQENDTKSQIKPGKGVKNPKFKKMMKLIDTGFPVMHFAITNTGKITATGLIRRNRRKPENKSQGMDLLHAIFRFMDMIKKISVST